MARERIEIDLVLDDGSIKKAFISAEQSATNFGKKAGDSIESGIGGGATRALGALKNSLLGLGAAFAGGAALSRILGNFTELETAFAEIKTIIPDVAQANDQLQQSFIDLSAQFGTSAADQAKSFYSIISAGITDSAAAQDALTQANKLAIGGLTDTETAIDILTTSINAYGAENLSAAKASDVLFGTVRLGKTTVEELGSSLGQILPTASSLKVGFEDVAGAVAALTTKGVSTSQAVTQLNAVLTAVLNNQATARSLGPEVAKAFSLQALQAKGLSGFLKDLNFALGGSEQGLSKLLGSAEASKAVLALAGDGFVTVTDNINSLKTSVGAADAAFNIINETTAQQTANAFSGLSAIFTKVADDSSGSIFAIAKGFNTGVQSILQNFDALAAGVARTFQLTVSAFLGLSIAPTIFASVGFALSSLLGQFALLPTRLGIARISLQNFGISLGNFVTRLRATRVSFTGIITGIKSFVISLKGMNISLSSALASLRSFRIGVKLAGVGLQALRVTAKLTAASLTLGLSFAIDEIITRFIQFKDEVGGFGNLFSKVSLIVQRSFNELIEAFAIGFRELLSSIPFVGAKLEAQFGSSLRAIQVNAAKALEEIEQDFRDLDVKIGLDTGQFVGPPVPADLGAAAPPPIPFPEIDLEGLAENKEKIETALESTTAKTKVELQKQVNIADVAFGNIAALFGFNSLQIQASQAELEATALESFKNIARAATEGFARSFSAIGSAIVNGEDAFAAFGKAILGVLGDVAIQAGTLYTLLGIASFNPAQVAAGIALTILGGVLKALGSGGASSPSGGGVPSGGGIDSNPIDGNLSPIDQQTQVGSAVSVNIQGDVLDSDETGLRIADILKEQGFQNAVIT